MDDNTGLQGGSAREPEPSPPLFEDPPLLMDDDTSLRRKPVLKKKKKGKIRAPPNLTIHARVYALGEKYGVRGLKALALEKFKKETDIHWSSDDFLRAAQEVYTSTIDHDRPMRDAVVETITKHPDLLDKEQVQDVVKSLELSFDLLMQFRKGLTGIDQEPELTPL